MEPNQSLFQKNKRDITIIGVITVIFLLVVGVLFFLKNKKQTGGGGGTIPNQAGSASLYSKNNNQDNSTSQNGDSTNTDNNYYYQEGLIKIWDRPVAGYGFYNKKGSSDNILVFVDSDTGFLYQKNLSQPTSTPVQITNSSYPNIREAYFLNVAGQNKIILQYSANNTVKSILANIPDYYSVANDLENITALDNNITNISISSDFSKAVYVVTKNKVTNNKKDLYSDWYLIDNMGTSKIYTSDLSSWKLQITNSTDIYAYNNDTAVEKSNLYILNNNTNSLKQISIGHTGSSYLINNNSVLTSIFTSNGLKIYENQSFYGGAFGDSSLSVLSFNTLTNKCSLSEIIICGVPKEIKNYDSGLPDAWYQGLTSWQDDLYIVNNDYPSGQMLFNLNIDGQVNDSFDLKNINITKNQDHVLFTNKNDGSLWSLNISNILNTNTGD
ncbi:MAG: hypothetical protein QG630_73 [Patescibacteria group bacterium]|nr:hypothetical protein [Patescibacteria group bacterium]